METKKTWSSLSNGQKALLIIAALLIVGNIAWPKMVGVYNFFTVTKIDTSLLHPVTAHSWHEAPRYHRTLNNLMGQPPPRNH